MPLAYCPNCKGIHKSLDTNQVFSACPEFLRLCTKCAAPGHVANNCVETTFAIAFMNKLKKEKAADLAAAKKEEMSKEEEAGYDAITAFAEAEMKKLPQQQRLGASSSTTGRRPVRRPVAPSSAFGQGRPPVSTSRGDSGSLGSVTQIPVLGLQRPSQPGPDHFPPFGRESAPSPESSPSSSRFQGAHSPLQGSGVGRDVGCDVGAGIGQGIAGGVSGPGLQSAVSNPFQGAGAATPDDAPSGNIHCDHCTKHFDTEADLKRHQKTVKRNARKKENNREKGRHAPLR